MDSSDILFERRGAAGIVTLNRPKALNAVTHEMVRALARHAVSAPQRVRQLAAARATPTL